jgi:hypothetical protein
VVEVMLVLDEVVDELSKEDEEDWYGGVVHHRADAPRRLEQLVQRVHEAEKLVERHTLLWGHPVRQPLAVADGVGSPMATGAGWSRRQEGAVLPPNYRSVLLERNGRVLVVFFI